MSDPKRLIKLYDLSPKVPKIDPSPVPVFFRACDVMRIERVFLKESLSAVFIEGRPTPLICEGSVDEVRMIILRGGKK